MLKYFNIAGYLHFSQGHTTFYVQWFHIKHFDTNLLKNIKCRTCLYFKHILRTLPIMTFKESIKGFVGQAIAPKRMLLQIWNIYKHNSCFPSRLLCMLFLARTCCDIHVQAMKIIQWTRAVIMVIMSWSVVVTWAEYLRRHGGEVWIKQLAFPLFTIQSCCWTDQENVALFMQCKTWWVDK